MRFNVGAEFVTAEKCVASEKRVAFAFEIVIIGQRGNLEGEGDALFGGDRKSTRLNSSHSQISYAVFCLKKKKKLNQKRTRLNSSHRQISYDVFCLKKKKRQYRTKLIFIYKATRKTIALNTQSYTVYRKMSHS